MSPSAKKYDAFISFRGEDIRKTFLSHLRQAFYGKRIKIYVDSNLEKGDEIWPTLSQAIHDSHISVIVLSQDYAGSKWCLEELLEILKCKKHQNQVVIPVFYGTVPSDVRKQTGTYARAFEKYKNEFKNKSDKVSAWKDALTEAANMSGWDSTEYRDESELIVKIVNDVDKKLSLMYPNELKGLVEIDENNSSIESYLKEFTTIGIWGMGGVGKTTIARKMFAKYFAQYDSVCFLEKVRENSTNLGEESVRHRLLSELLKQEFNAHGYASIERRLRGRKVFIVLDDVDTTSRLQYLCQDLTDLGPGSRLIITTRNNETLGNMVDKVYEVKKWDPAESLKLFSLKAFDQSDPKEGYLDVSKRAVACAGGLPLALQIFGLHFRPRDDDLKFWKSELDYMENKGKSWKGIQEVLQVSYNGLEIREKNMFLDIAFFFKDEHKDFVTRILDACYMGAVAGIKILEDKALISISNSNRIQMHDLLQKMAWDIVRSDISGHQIDHGQRSRLRDIDEVRDVLKNNNGTSAIQGITLDLSQNMNFHLQADTFNMMTKLQFLRLYLPLDTKRSANVLPPTTSVQSHDTLMYSSTTPVSLHLPDTLRYLEWNGYPFKSLPPNYFAELLVELRLQHSNIENLWQGVQELVNLEALDLSECKEFKKLPDLSRASKLKWLYLSGCENLCEVRPDVFSMDTLVSVLLDRCKKLTSIVSKKRLKSLEKINVYGCSSLRQFSLSSDLLETLDLSGTGIKILHSSVGHQSQLQWLNLEGLRLENLPDELSCLKSLTELWLSNCDAVTKLKLEVILNGLTSLKILYLKDCCNLSELPDNISSLSSLYELRLDGSSVEMLPSSIKDLSELEILSLDNCKKLHSLPELPPLIKEFHVDNCSSLVTVSTLKTFSATMKGKAKYISFKNCTKSSLVDHIMEEEVILMMKSAAFHNLLVQKYGTQTHSYNYNSTEVCLPGSRVPRGMKYRTTDSSSITTELDELSRSRGFILSVVVSPLSEHHKNNKDAKIQCQCYSEDGEKLGHASTWQHKGIADLNSDHVFVWYDPYHYDSISDGTDGTKVSFEFCVTTDTDEPHGLFGIKECGAFPIYNSEFPSIVSSLNLDDSLANELQSLLEPEPEPEPAEPEPEPEPAEPEPEPEPEPAEPMPVPSDERTCCCLPCLPL